MLTDLNPGPAGSAADRLFSLERRRLLHRDRRADRPRPLPDRRHRRRDDPGLAAGRAERQRDHGADTIAPSQFAAIPDGAGGQIVLFAPTTSADGRGALAERRNRRGDGTGQGHQPRNGGFQSDPAHDGRRPGLLRRDHSRPSAKNSGGATGRTDGTFCVADINPGAARVRPGPARRRRQPAACSATATRPTARTVGDRRHAGRDDAGQGHRPGHVRLDAWQSEVPGVAFQRRGVVFRQPRLRLGTVAQRRHGGWDVLPRQCDAGPRSPSRTAWRTSHSTGTTAEQLWKTDGTVRRHCMGRRRRAGDLSRSHRPAHGCQRDRFLQLPNVGGRPRALEERWHRPWHRPGQGHQPRRRQLLPHESRRPERQTLFQRDGRRQRHGAVDERRHDRGHGAGEGHQPRRR